MSFLKSVLTICFYILSLIVKLQNKQINAIWNYITQLGKVLAFKKIELHYAYQRISISYDDLFKHPLLEIKLIID